MRIAINGFGRIGRIFFRQANQNKNFKIVAVNDLAEKENLLYLLKYDSVYGRFEGNANSVKFFQEKNPVKLPWKDLSIDVVVESTGIFTSYEKAKTHLDAGAKRVVITAPAQDDGQTKTFTPNVGVDFLREGRISSNASCTTNATTPVAAVMQKSVGIKKAILTTVHGYTASQGLVDGPSGNFREGRAAAQNIIPTSTGAALATAKAIPDLRNIFDGIAMRVPVIVGSIVDFTFLAKRKTSVEEINNIFREAAGEKQWNGILTVTEEPLVSTDILGNPYGAIVDLTFTRVVDGDLVKVLSWYDNEWGYCSMLIKHIETLRALL